MSTGEAAKLVERLNDLMASFEDVIQRKAEDLAEPMIRDAEARAKLAIVEARGEVQHKEDVNRELGRRLQAAGRQQNEMRQFRDHLAAALGVPRTTPWPSLAAEIETRLKESKDG